MRLEDFIRDVPDFPKPGIMFKDITPLLKDPFAFKDAVDQLFDHHPPDGVDAVVGIEARGFLLAAPLAYRMGRPLVPVRKKGKLPFTTEAVTYSLEYGSDTVEVHIDGFASGQRVLIVDDLLATGGTVAATASLVEKMGGQVASIAVLVELTDLKGRDRLGEYEVVSLIKY